MLNIGIPKEMEAVVLKDGKAQISKKHVPYVEDGQLLIEVVTIAVNPMDWKIVEFAMGPENSILGCDVAGQVIAIGSGVPSEEFNVGDYVCSFIHGGSNENPENGAFAQYCTVDAVATFKLPHDIVKELPKGVTHIDEGPIKSLEEAVSLPVGLITAGAILKHEIGIKLEWLPAKPQIDSSILIWGGATSVGQLLLQLVKKLNVFKKIIVVASKVHNEQLTKYGADIIYDYHEKDVVEKIQSNHKDLTYLIDAVSNEQTINQVYKCTSKEAPATIIQLEYLNIEQITPEERRDNVKIIGTLIYLVSGYKVKVGSYKFPANPQYRKDIIKFIKFINPKIINGEIHHIPIKLYDQGLEDIPKMMEKVKEGHNNGEKLVTVLKK